MGFDVGAGGAFGIELPAYEQELGDVYKNLLKAEDAWSTYGLDPEDVDNGAENTDDEKDDILDQIYVEHAPKLIEKFKELGIVVPPNAHILKSASDDESPGRQATEEDTLILGFGAFTKPWDWPDMDETFRNVADFHTWVWGG